MSMKLFGRSIAKARTLGTGHSSRRRAAYNLCTLVQRLSAFAHIPDSVRIPGR
jgi:hypothetical protein